MSLRAKLRGDLTIREKRVIGQLTIRNIVWSGIAIICVLLSVGLTAVFKVPQAIASWIYVFVGVPAFAIGFWQPANGQKPEQYTLDILSHIFGTKTWVYKSESPVIQKIEQIMKPEPSVKKKRNKPVIREYKNV